MDTLSPDTALFRSLVHVDPGVFPRPAVQAERRMDVRAGFRQQHILDHPDDPLLVDDGRCRRSLAKRDGAPVGRSEEHTSELQSLMRISYAVFCLKKKNITKHNAAIDMYTSNIKRSNNSNNSVSHI